MCGIAGWVGENTTRSQGAVRAMTEALARRGPNATGLECWPQAVLGHRRLSIYDLSDAGRQPMFTEDRELAVVFNGSIYNFRGLREELASLGHQFRSNTDTEVILAGYREWGLDGILNRSRGMFAIGLWDNAKNKFFLVRDRLGVKPLHYAVKDRSLVFASTARALHRAGVVDSMNPAAIFEYLQYGYIPDDLHIWQGAHKLPAAHVLEWSDGKVQSIRQYWSPPGPCTSSDCSFEEAVQETERLFLQAVERRLDADVPVGSLLSAGVDSSLVCWAIGKLGGDVTAFTISTRGDDTDEGPAAAETAKLLNVRHRIIELSRDDLPSIQDLSIAFGEPFATASALGMLRVSRAVRDEATVLLTGDGGDDVFLGYPEHRVFQLAARTARWLPPGAGALAATMRAMGGPLRKASTLLDYGAGGLPALLRVQSRMELYRSAGLFGPLLRNAELQSIRVAHRRDGRQLLQEFLEHDRRGRFVSEYLTKVDGATMHYALEARSPFLDQDLWEFAASTPVEVRLRDGQLKAILRELALRRIGEKVAKGRKLGFSIPVGRWMIGRWRPQMDALFQDMLATRYGFLDETAIRRAFEEASRKEEAPLQFWYIAALESWLREEAKIG
jgi:asparagine synthase (glutamine-hydrolysing)